MNEATEAPKLLCVRANVQMFELGLLKDRASTCIIALSDFEADTSDLQRSQVILCFLGSPPILPFSSSCICDGTGVLAGCREH